MAINAHKALFSANSDQNFLAALTVDPDDVSNLRDVRETLREGLKAGFADWPNFIRKQRLFETVALSFADGYDRGLRPKFRMQGSWSYHTLNRTTQQPPQEIDLDDGVFLPISFLTQDGEAHPAIVSDAYFAAVEKILLPICEENGWDLVSGKTSCVRVQVKVGAHVDLALYAIPDDEFIVLVEKAEARAMETFDAKLLDEAALFEQVYATLPDDHIMLAHREEGWKPSDPRKLETWFEDAIKRHGQQLRRVCRYLKGWRDSSWTGCRLSSIALMLAVVSAFDEASAAPPENRDDLALLMVANGLAARLSNAIENPVVPGQFLDEGWDDCRDEFVAKANELARELKVALSADTRASALTALRRTLGDYIPNDIGLLEVTVPASAAILTQGILSDVPADEREPVKIGGEARYG